MKILYYERIFFDDQTCTDVVKQIHAIKIFRQNGLLYAYLDQFNVAVIELARIIQITCD